MTAARKRPLLIYDGDCGFCRRWIARWRRSTGDRVRYLPFQRLGMSRRCRVPRRAARTAVQLIEPAGRRSSGSAAVFRVLLRSRCPWVRLAARAGLMRGVHRIAEAVYRYVAAHRSAFSRAERVLGRVLGPAVPRHRPWVFLSRPGLALGGLGIVYFVAFASLKRQVLGLYGARGILPIDSRLRDIDRAAVGRDGGRLDQRRTWWQRFRLVPSLLWFDASDAGLKRLCTVGQTAGAALALGIGGPVGRRLAAATAWAAYLSFVSVGRDFLRFQWDVLLLEAGLQAVLGRPRRLLNRLLAFRLQFESGLAKLASRDITWRNLSACCYHQETQPLPTPVGWYAHHLPRRLQKAATASTLFVECAVPFLAFGPRRLRQPAFAALTAFQGLIALTGNYAFFNWLTAVLNLALVELPASTESVRPGDHQAWQATTAILETVAAAPLLILEVADLVDRLRPDGHRPDWVQRLADAAAPFHVVSSYGLFSAMTTERPEIVIEGSNDGDEWREYGFRYKPGDVARGPRWAAPHQPRLDWQMWFAALGYPPAWFPRFIERLLEGTPEVLALLERNPFPAGPPRYIRAVLYDYKMTDLSTQRQTGRWWMRTKRGLYFPVCTLGAGRRQTAHGTADTDSVLQ